MKYIKTIIKQDAELLLKESPYVHESRQFKEGFDFYACELDKEYYEAQDERFNRECLGEVKQSNGIVVTQNKLFDL